MKTIWYVTLFAACALGAQAGTFTPELMLQSEGVGEVRFTPDGSRLYYDRQLPYHARASFDLDLDWRRGLSVLHVTGRDGGEAVPLARDEGDRTWYLDTSPSGRYVLFGWLDGGVQRIGVLDHVTGTERRLQVNGSAVAGQDTYAWLSDTVVLVASQSDEQQRAFVSPRSWESEVIHALERRTREGREASVTVSGGGRYLAPDRRQRRIRMVRVDVATGEAETVAEDVFLPVHNSAPGGRRVAWLREVGHFNVIGLSTPLNVMTTSQRRELVIYDENSGLHVVPGCDGCTVDRGGTMRWSPSGDQLLFSARYRDGDRLGYRYYIYDARDQSVSQFQPRGLDFEVVNDMRRQALYLPLTWLDDGHFAVRTWDRDAGEEGDQDYRWHLVGRDGTVIRELTDGLPRTGREALRSPVAVHRGDLLMLAGGRLWRVDQQARALPLTPPLEGEVQRYCAPPGVLREIPGMPCEVVHLEDADAHARSIVLDVKREGASSSELWLLDLESEPGGFTRLEVPTADTEVVEASVAAGAAVYLQQDREGAALVMVRSDGTRHLLWRFNTHLSDVRAPARVRLDRREPGESEDRHDWLLLPPGHRDGQRHPLLVYFYPETNYGPELEEHDLRQVSFLNLNLAAAKGYAVLLASMRISPPGSAGEPMREMHEQLIRAAENAVARGYADPERWALFGHSFGGYGVNSVITQTGRFKAAIASASSSNLFTSYGSGMHVQPATGTHDRPASGAIWAEGQGRMAGPPWENVERYARNSPVLHADRITTPLLLVHGDRDSAHVNEAEQLFLALQRLGRDVQFVRYWGEAHHLQSPANIIDLWERIDAFLAGHLGQPGTTDEAEGQH